MLVQNTVDQLAGRVIRGGAHCCGDTENGPGWLRGLGYELILCEPTSRVRTLQFHRVTAVSSRFDADRSRRGSVSILFLIEVIENDQKDARYHVSSRIG